MHHNEVISTFAEMHSIVLEIASFLSLFCELICIHRVQEEACIGHQSTEYVYLRADIQCSYVYIDRCFFSECVSLQTTIKE